ncbi:MAG: hypothetical protein QOJ05_498, partial [Verrucomicrobiota bacterium]
NWGPLRLNMPATSVRDLIVKDDDLAVATHGRGFWILDNITPLRQIALENQATTLFKPQTALRIRWSLNPDTPLPPDEPAGENPPDGAMIDYFLTEDSSGPVIIEIKDGKGNVARRYSSADKPILPDVKKLRIPEYWIRPPQSLAPTRGLHRFLWDLRFAPVPHIEPEYPMAAIFGNTPAGSTAPWVLPGDYQVVLTANGKSYSQPLTVKMDPRVHATAQALNEQFDLSRKLYELRPTLVPIGEAFVALATEVSKAKGRAANNPAKEHLDAFAKKLEEFGPPNARPGAAPAFHLLDSVERLFGILDGVDAAPTSAVKTGVAEILRTAPAVTEKWRALVSQDLPALNEDLERAGLGKIELASSEK